MNTKKKWCLRVLLTVATLAVLMAAMGISALAECITLGDANSDGEINMKDVLTVRKYVAGLPVDIDTMLADANDDGMLNMKDVLTLRRYIASIDPSLPTHIVTEPTETVAPTETVVPTEEPTVAPTEEPTVAPTEPTSAPATEPTTAPTQFSGYYEDYDPKSGIDYNDPAINFIEGTGNTLGVWWWMPTTDEDVLRDYLELMKKNQVTEIYYECYPWLYAPDDAKLNKATLHDFVTLAGEYGMRVAVLYDDRSVMKGNQNKMAIFQRVSLTQGHEYTFTCKVSNLNGELGLAFSDEGETVTTFQEGDNSYTFTAESGIKYVMLVGNRTSYTVSDVALVDVTAGDGANLMKNGDFSVNDTRTAEFGWSTGNVESWSIENGACTVQNGFTPFNKTINGFLEYKALYGDDGLYAVHCDVEPKSKTEIEKYVKNFIPDIASARERGVPIELDLSCTMVSVGGELVTYEHPEYGTITGIYNIIAANCDCMCLMSYRDNANNIFGCGSEAIKSAKIYHTKLLFGIELGDSGEGDNVDFSDEGLYTAWSELYKLDQKLTNRDFGKDEGEEFSYGYAIHSERTMKNLRKHWGNPIADPTV